MASKDKGRGRSRRRMPPAVVINVHATFNNTVLTVADKLGNVLMWESSGASGFKGNRKGTPYAAQLAAENLGKKAVEQGGRRGPHPPARPRLRAGIGGARPERLRPEDHRDQGCDADPAQRLPAAQAAAGVGAMARYRGPVCKLSRREGEDLELKSGMKNFDGKCKSKTPLGMGHGARPPGKPSDYQLHLRAKQKLRRYYGVLERQFRNYYRKAAGGRTDTGESLLQLLESRLDNVVYRIGLGVTRAAARQMVSHNQVLVDGQRVNIPSYQVRPGQRITLSENARAHSRVKEAVAHAEMRELSRDWLDVDLKDFSGKVIGAPTIQDLMHQFDVSLVVEYYSK